MPPLGCTAASPHPVQPRVPTSAPAAQSNLRAQAVSSTPRNNGNQPCKRPLYRLVQRGLFRAVKLVLNRSAIGRPHGLPADGWHERVPRW